MAIFYLQGLVGRSSHGTVLFLSSCWMSELQVALVPVGNSGWKNLCAEIFASLELKVIFMKAQFLSRTSLIMTHVALENDKESSIKKILAIEVFNDRSQLQERK